MHPKNTPDNSLDSFLSLFTDLSNQNFKCGIIPKITATKSINNIFLELLIYSKNSSTHISGTFNLCEELPYMNKQQQLTFYKHHLLTQHRQHRPRQKHYHQPPLSILLTPKKLQTPRQIPRTRIRLPRLRLLTRI